MTVYLSNCAGSADIEDEQARLAVEGEDAHASFFAGAELFAMAEKAFSGWLVTRPGYALAEQPVREAYLADYLSALGHIGYQSQGGVA